MKNLLPLSLLSLGIIIAGAGDCARADDQVVQDQDASSKILYVKQSTVDNLKSELDDFCEWCEWSSEKPCGLTFVYDNVREELRDVPFASWQGREDSIEQRLKDVATKWLSKAHELRNTPCETACEREYCDIIYSCAACIFVSAAWEYVYSASEEEAQKGAEFFASTVKKLVYDFIVPMLNFSAQKYINVATQDLYLQQYCCVAAKMFGRVFFERRILLGLQEHIDERLSEEGCVALGEEKQFLYEHCLFPVEIVSAKCKIDGLVSKGGLWQSNPRLRGVYKRLIGLFANFYNEWNVYDARSGIGKVIFPVSKTFRDVDAFRHAFYKIIRDGFDDGLKDGFKELIATGEFLESPQT